MKKTRLIAALLLLAQVGISCAQTSKITVKVTDESDQIVTNANVSAGFRTKQKPGWGWGSGKASRVVGTTDGNGYCILEGSGDDNGVGVSVTKVGYYGSSKVFIFTNLNTFTKQWEPWNPTIGVLLKPIGIQVPMYKREIDQLKFPSEGKPVGFDLMVGDWVAPHGKGSVQDLIFQVDLSEMGTITNRYGPVILWDRKLSVTFPNDGDGIQSVFAPPQGGSNLRLPRQAPIEGYESLLTKQNYRRSVQSGAQVPHDLQSHSDFREDQNYFFRIRTKKDEHGNIISALYGKIEGDFNRPQGGGIGNKLSFAYYLNSEPNSRNMEFDESRNLAK